MSNRLAELPGADKLYDWFGYWPDFHDAEIVSLSLSRVGASILRVYPYDPVKPAVVDFVLHEITDLSLNDFSRQNVISVLTVEKLPADDGAPIVRLTLGPCFGVAGHLDAKHVSIEVTPGKSPDGLSRW